MKPNLHIHSSRLSVSITVIKMVGRILIEWVVISICMLLAAAAVIGVLSK